MATEHPHHRHLVVNPASILRMSVLERLALAVAVIAAMWTAVFWAMS